MPSPLKALCKKPTSSAESPTVCVLPMKTWATRASGCEGAKYVSIALLRRAISNPFGKDMIQFVFCKSLEATYFFRHWATPKTWTTSQHEHASAAALLHWPRNEKFSDTLPLTSQV